MYVYDTKTSDKQTNTQQTYLIIMMIFSWDIHTSFCWFPFAFEVYKLQRHCHLWTNICMSKMLESIMEELIWKPKKIRKVLALKICKAWLLFSLCRLWTTSFLPNNWWRDKHTCGVSTCALDTYSPFPAPYSVERLVKCNPTTKSAFYRLLNAWLLSFSLS